MTKIAVVIASTGRPTELARWVEHCAAQTLQPSDLVLSIAQAADLPVDFQQGSAVVVAGRQGSSAQRNSGIAALSNKPDILAFFDDDYVPSRFCLAGIAQLYAAEPDVVAASGRLLADGINGPGIDFSEARAIVDDFDIAFSEPNLGTTPATSTYGCNMTFRYSAIGDERFDERLLLYGWQEDVDFSARVGLRGKVVFTGAYVGVHQGAKRGRTSGKRFGYSQNSEPDLLASERYHVIWPRLRPYASQYCPEHCAIATP